VVATVVWFFLQRKTAGRPVGGSAVLGSFEAQPRRQRGGGEDP
jgi:hypothetical protein